MLYGTVFKGFRVRPLSCSGASGVKNHWRLWLKRTTQWDVCSLLKILCGWCGEGIGILWIEKLSQISLLLRRLLKTQFINLVTFYAKFITRFWTAKTLRWSHFEILRIWKIKKIFIKITSFFSIVLNWSRVGLPCCVSFKCKDHILLKLSGRGNCKLCKQYCREVTPIWPVNGYDFYPYLVGIMWFVYGPQTVYIWRCILSYDITM